MKKAWLNKKYIAKLACRWTTGVFSLLGIVGTFASLSEIAPEEWPVPYKILLSLGIVAVVWLFFLDLSARPLVLNCKRKMNKI